MPMTWLLFRKILLENVGHSSLSKSYFLEKRVKHSEEVISDVIPMLKVLKAAPSTGYTQIGI